MTRQPLVRWEQTQGRKTGMLAHAHRGFKHDHFSNESVSGYRVYQSGVDLEEARRVELTRYPAGNPASFEIRAEVKR